MRHNSARELEGQEKIEDPGRIPWGKTNNASNKLLAANAKEKQNDLLAAKSENNNLQLNGTKQNVRVTTLADRCFVYLGCNYC